MGILGEDGDGYELAVRLENSSAWREWLGSSSYAKLLPHLSSPTAWHSFMNSPTLLPLQMRVRALLFDKVAGCLFTDNSKAFESINPSLLHPSYLQLDANGVYFLLDQDAEDWKRLGAEGSTVIGSLLIKNGLEALSSLNVNEGGQETKGAAATIQQRNTSQATQNFSNLMSPKQELSRPSLNKVKKVEAWDSFDAKRPTEMVGAKHKKLRSPKISSKSSLLGDPNLNSSNRPEKMSSNKSPPGSLPPLEESKYSAIGAGRMGHIECGENCRLWYDRCLDKHLQERMQRIAHRSAQQKLPFKEQDACIRTPEGMAAYIDQCSCSNRLLSGGRFDPDIKAARHSTQKPTDDGSKDHLMPEFKFLGNHVPDNPVPAKRRRWSSSDIEFRGLLDQLDIPPGNVNSQAVDSHNLWSKGRPSSQTEPDSTVGLRQGLLSGSSTAGQCSSKIQDQDAEHMMQVTVAKMVAGAGFEGLKQSSMDLLCDMLGRHIRKLGSGLRVLVDNYRKHCSQTEMLKMYMQTTGSSVEDLVEHMKASSQIEIPVGLQVSSQVVSNQRKRMVPPQVTSQQVAPRQPPSPQSPLHQPQHPFSDKTLKRRQPSNLGRSRKSEKERLVGDGKYAGERKLMQGSPGGSRLNSQQPPWHSQMPQVESQSGTALQNYKQQLSSLQQLQQ